MEGNFFKTNKEKSIFAFCFGKKLEKETRKNHQTERNKVFKKDNGIAKVYFSLIIALMQNASYSYYNI